MSTSTRSSLIEAPEKLRCWERHKEAEAGAPRDQGQAGLHKETVSKLPTIVKTCDGADGLRP